MSPNLVSLIMQFLTPDAIAKIASALGLDRSILQKAVIAAIPTILGYLTSAATKPGGERQLANALAQQPAGAFDTLMNVLGGAGQKSLADQKSLVEKGSSLLSGLLGGSTQDSLTRAIGQYAGIGEGTSKSLIGMLGPLVLDTLGQQQRKEGLDTSGLVNLLGSQRQQFAAALPSGFGPSDLLDSLGGAARTAAAAGTRTAHSATSTVTDAGRRAAGATASASRNWLYWIIPALALAGLLFYLFRPTEPVVQQSATPVQNLTVAGLDVGRQATDSIANLRTTLGGITDVSSAQAALPRLQEITAQFDRVTGVRGQLSADQRKALTGMVNPAMAALNQLFDKVLAIPGVSQVLKPAIDTLRARLATLVA